MRQNKHSNHINNSNNNINNKEHYDFIIIGAGVSGIAAAIELKHQKFSFKIIEKDTTIGGCWNYTSDLSELQTDRSYYTFPGVDYPDNSPTFPKKQTMLNYFEKTVEKYDIKQHVMFNTIALPYKFNDSSNLWQVKIITNNNYKNVNPFNRLIYAKHILYCGGKNTIPSYPNIIQNIPKINYSIRTPLEYNSNYTNIIHSKYFNIFNSINHIDYNKKKIVIIGNGASSCDILNIIINNTNKLNKSNNLNKHSISDSDYEITIIYRSDKFFVPKYICGVPGSVLLSRTLLK